MWFREPSTLLVIVFFFPLITFLLLRIRSQQLKLAKKANLEIEPNSLRLRSKIVISTLLVSFLVLALAQPQMHSVKEIPVRSDTQIAFLLDVSLSMAGSKEPNPCISGESSCAVPQAAVLRIDRAKEIIKKTMDSLGVVSVGVYGFSGITVWQMPFTYSPQKELLDNGLTAGSLQAVCNNAEKCSDLGSAVYQVASDFGQKYEKKIIVILSDGDSDKPVQQYVLNMLAVKNIKVFSVSIGSDNEHIWLYDNDGNSTGYFPKPLPVEDTDLTLLANSTGGRVFRENEVEALAPAIVSVMGNSNSESYVTSEGDTSLSPLFFFASMATLLVFALIYIVGVQPPLNLISIRSFFRVKK